MDAAPLTLADRVPMVCTVEDLCRFLQKSRSQVYRLLQTGLLPFQEIEPRIGAPRFRGADLLLWLDGHHAGLAATAHRVSARGTA
jgi:hypothetical protein